MRLWQSSSLLALFLLSQISWAQNPVRILSLDGGGVRGIIELVVLSQMEKELGRPISEIFDMVAGTSTGGIIALGLVTPDENGRPRFSAKDILKAYLDHSPKIFDSSLCHKITTLGGLIGPKYEECGIKNLSESYLTDTMLSEAIIPTLITGYDVEHEKGMGFFSLDARDFPNKDCLMREAALATAAAPTFFPLASVHYSDTCLDYVADGALFKSNPAMLAYMKAKELYKNRPIDIYSIGTGKAEINFSRQKNGGLLQWMSSIVEHLQNSDCANDNNVLHDLINKNGEQEQGFYRLDIPLDRNHRAIDDASIENMRYLVKLGKTMAQDPVFKQMTARLQKALQSQNS